MLLSNKRYADPVAVLKSLVDDFGNQIMIGEQKDIGEFNLNLLERVEEGLGEFSQKEDTDEEEDKNNNSEGQSLIKQGVQK